MTNMPPPDEVLKADVRGRVRTPRARWEALLDEFERSGVSGQKFEALVGGNYQTFAVWVQQRRRAAWASILRRRNRRCSECASAPAEALEEAEGVRPKFEPPERGAGPSGTPLVSGYLPDYGAAFASRGNGYQLTSPPLLSRFQFSPQGCRL